MKRKVYLALCCGTLLAIMLFLPAEVNQRIDSAIGDVFSPFTHVLRRGPALTTKRFRKRSSLLDEIDKTAIELEHARYEIQRLKALEHENQRLRNTLGIGARSSHELIAANVVARNISGWWRKIQLDKGSKHGVEKDLTVINGRGMIGRIISVSTYNSKVLLLTDPSFRVSARTAETEAFGVVRGQSIGSNIEPLCKMKFISREVQIKPGEQVVSSGLGGIHPAGIIIGFVKDIRMDASGLYQEADILPAANLKALDIAFVVIER